ncbi:MAG: ribbon-helix-helix protein, CopG family [Actinobacteria bacterium]|nr:ribbon-helix-helix protein, CopG family [Actinomycetota bacterium]
MRTTLTLDDDLAAQLRRLARETGRPFKQLVNEALRAGLMPTSADRSETAPTPTFDLGLRPGIDLIRARHLATELEDEETLRKLELRK